MGANRCDPSFSGTPAPASSAGYDSGALFLLHTSGWYCILFSHNSPRRTIATAALCFVTGRLKPFPFTFPRRTPPFSLSLFGVDIRGEWFGEATSHCAFFDREDLIRLHPLRRPSALPLGQLAPSAVAWRSKLPPPPAKNSKFSVEARLTFA